MDLEPKGLQRAAAEAARLAGAELMSRFRGARTIARKQAIDLVTDADTAAERVIVEYLRRRFPDHALLAEEGGGTAGTAPYRWIVDPLDGTTNYAHRSPHFAVSVGVEDAQGLAAGAVFDPTRDELFEGCRGGGAFLNGERLQVTAEGALSGALLATGFPYDVWDRPEPPVALLDAFVRRGQGMRRAGSAALDCCYVAAGRLDGYFEVAVKPWDVAAGALLVREAGGAVTHLDGSTLAIDRGGAVLVTNGALHAEMLQVARQALAGVRGVPFPGFSPGQG